MEKEIIFNIQAASTKDEPIYLLGGRRLSKDEAFSLKILDLIIPDSTYTEIFKSEFLSVRKSDGNPYNSYIVIGNLNQRDVKGRRIAFGCYLKSESDDIKEILSDVNECLSTVQYSIDLPNVDSSPTVKKVSNRKNKVLIYLAASIAVGLGAGYLISQGFKNNQNESNYEQRQTNQTAESDSIR